MLMNIWILKNFFKKKKNNQLKFDDAVKKQKDLLDKINEVKIGKKTPEQEKVITNLEKTFLIFLETIRK